MESELKLKSVERLIAQAANSLRSYICLTDKPYVEVFSIDLNVIIKKLYIIYLLIITIYYNILIYYNRISAVSAIKSLITYKILV